MRCSSSCGSRTVLHCEHLKDAVHKHYGDGRPGREAEAERGELHAAALQRHDDGNSFSGGVHALLIQDRLVMPRQSVGGAAVMLLNGTARQVSGLLAVQTAINVYAPSGSLANCFAHQPQ
jgi:hypothetical protein